jgi:polyisoprenoid-binding protein YceI
MKGLLICLILLAVPLGLSAQTIKPDNPISFSINNAGIQVKGTITDWEIEVEFDARKPEKSSIRGTANVQSLETGIKLRDRHLQGRQYFDSQKYPLIYLNSKSIKSVGKNKFVGVFELQLKDIKKEVQIPFTLSDQQKGTVFSGEFVINRLDYGIGEKSLVLSDSVKVNISFFR